jgi:hypothetical protein
MVKRGSRGVRSGAAIAALFLLACSKGGEEKAGGGSVEPPQAVENREKAAQLSAPALFAHIPADTPYVVASFEPIPRSYWQNFLPLIKLALDAAPPGDPATATDPGEKFALAFLRDLRADFSEAGIKKLLGISADQRFAIYGIGVVPVARIELADSKALLGTVERLQKESGLALPTASAGGRSYWRFAEGDGLFVVAVHDEQLILSAGPLAMVEAALPFVLGVEKPAPNMSDGGPVKKVAALHGLAGYAVGYVDAANLLKLLTMANFFRGAGAGPALPPACMEELGGLVRRFPRIVFGYDELSDKRTAARMILEAEPGLVTRLKQLAVEVPGLSRNLAAERPLFAFGLGIDLDKARQLALDTTTSVETIARSCGNEDMANDMSGARAALSQPLPPGLDKVRGAVVNVMDGELIDGKPRNLEAYGVIATEDPAALIGLLRQQAPPGQVPEVPSDGKFHDFLPEGVVPGLSAVRVSIKPKALVAVTGSKAPDAAESALAKTGTSPLFLISYDFGKLMKKIMSESAGQTPPPEIQRIALSLFGNIATWLYPTDQGLTLAVSMDAATP